MMMPASRLLSHPRRSPGATQLSLRGWGAATSSAQSRSFSTIRNPRSHDIHESEKLHGKLLAAQQESQQTMHQQMRALAETNSELNSTKEEIAQMEGEAYDAAH